MIKQRITTPLVCTLSLLMLLVPFSIQANENQPSPIITSKASPQIYTVSNQRTLQADGFDKGVDTYQLIKNFGGKRPIESPDFYEVNHPGEPHIYEASDNIVGNHFVFTLHKNLDKDRNKLAKDDRQRNEIKAYGGSERALKAYKNETLAYQWKFKLNEGITLSKNFGHFFQLKAVDDGPGYPILTISGRDKRGEWLEVIHTLKKLTLLKKVPLAPLKGKWLEVKCFVNYQDSGQLELLISEVVSKRTVLHLSLNDIDMWRGTKEEHFVRPKWGIYRSLRSKEMLRDDEEKVFFADFVVQKLNAAPAQ